jgi:hypothetical protein
LVEHHRVTLPYLKSATPRSTVASSAAGSSAQLNLGKPEDPQGTTNVYPNPNDPSIPSDDLFPTGSLSGPLLYDSLTNYESQGRIVSMGDDQMLSTGGGGLSGINDPFIPSSIEGSSLFSPSSLQWEKLLGDPSSILSERMPKVQSSSSEDEGKSLRDIVREFLEEEPFPWVGRKSIKLLAELNPMFSKQELTREANLLLLCKKDAYKSYMVALNSALATGLTHEEAVLSLTQVFNKGFRLFKDTKE